jgi:hemolysin activation/secretion protein
VLKNKHILPRRDKQAADRPDGLAKSGINASRSVLTQGLVALCLALACAQSLHAQAPPTPPRTGDVGEQLRDVTPKVAPQLPSTPNIEGLPKDEAKPEAADEGPAIHVERWVIEGNTIYPTAELQELLADTIGQDLTLGGLQDAVSKISLLYRRDGYPLAQAYLPPQTIENGTVHAVIVEARIGKVTLSEESQGLVDEDLIQSFLDTLPPGALIEDGTINRLALTLGDLPAMNAKLTLEPGATYGTTNVVVGLDADEWWQVSADTDNYGSYSTGRYRQGITAASRNLLGYGEEVDFRGQRTGYGQLYGSLGGTIATSGNGDRLGVTLSHLAFSLGGIYRGAGGGEATVAEINYRYPIVRDIQSTLIATVSFDHRLLTTTSPSLDDTRHEQVGTIGLNWSRIDSWGTFTFQGSTVFGSIAFDNAQAAAEDSTLGGPQTAGRFAKFTYAVSRLEPLYEGFSLYGSINGQYTGNKRLDSVESFSLGGPSGVRAYPLGETQGDGGYQASVELRYTPPDFEPSWGTPTAYTFFDLGEITQHPGIDPATDTPFRRGYGFGLQYTIDKVQFSTMVGWRLSGDPHSVPSYAPQEIYYQISVGF